MKFVLGTVQEGFSFNYPPHLDFQYSGWRVDLDIVILDGEVSYLVISDFTPEIVLRVDEVLEEAREIIINNACTPLPLLDQDTSIGITNYGTRI